ncbi:4-galactosyl-N-acetylglucosaminide 3-alpha-L-fucosyltransferase FUT6-like isoform X2 [Plodia interpunctella]|uniref:4-galactosyl-N-acetylglucosaminide 3-alpha-L-fucosyltransferase FUT6-like isoform X2 n=1 Tax=Plodia interpunctella TaxID=58824 RepID=UPI002367B0F3|nr:4-galactosyl-N-acetylglucosaminide 3-alpha-L-fucosyltransferase FUT6-like isoform X2 [Plodia interpunctella]
MLFKTYIKCMTITALISLLSALILTYIFITNDNSKEYIKPIDIKYILLWTSPYTRPFSSIGLGKQGFIKRNCSFTNCFVISARNHFGDYRKFHAVIFSISEFVNYAPFELPLLRSHRQKYVMSSYESSHYYGACTDRFNGYFNWTWSYRLDSDCRWEYIAVRDVNGNVIGPNKIMHWIKLEDMRPVSDALRKSLQTKTKAAAWFASNCITKSQRELFVMDLQIELFMPDGMYLNALNLGPRKLAQKMIFLMQNPKEYADYFRWKNHYTFHNRDESVDTDGVCAFCKLLNDEKKFKEKSVINNFREWWNSPDFCYKKIGIID